MIYKYPDDFINKIMCGDCIEVMKYIPNSSIDLVVTSPPYNIGIDYKSGWDSDRLTIIQYKEFSKKYMETIYRIIKQDGRFCLNIGYRLCTIVERSGMDYIEILNIAKEIGFKLRETIVWIKTRERENPQSFCGANTAWGSWLSASNPICRSFFEFIFIFYKEHIGKQSKGESTMTKKEFIEYTQNAWYFSAETNRLHPAPFPKELPMRCIKLLSYKDDIVLDPFVGWGTTAVVAKELYRQYIGIDNNSDYCEIARKRINSITGKLF